MSGLSASADLAALIVRLVRQAGRLGAARARTRSLDRRQPGLAWRRADLLWPLFTKGAK
ncbi:hypothetical protein ACFOD9_13310 [Novosphingobium bradum]|uniref:Uncharacterized protein n=1 Tax=Novosphingobium bradum TaxID=1737444 RepID=A0ABV7IRE2_9SPHN